MDNEVRTPETASTDAASPNLIQRVMLVFFSPSKLGEVLRVRSPWFWTLTIVAVVSTLAWALLPGELMQAVVEAQAAQRPQNQQAMDPETMIRVTRIFGALTILVITYVFAAVAAGILYLAFNVALGQDITYKQHLSAMSHVYWINLLGFLVLLPIWLAKLDVQVTLSLGLLLPEGPDSFVGHLLNSITIFGLWSTFALGVVESGLTGGKVTVGKAVTTMLVLYSVWVVVSALRATFLGG